MLRKCIEKKLDENAILNKSWQQHPSKQQLYGHFSSQKNIQDEQDMHGSAGDPAMNSSVTFFHEPLHLKVPVLANQ